MQKKEEIAAQCFTSTYSGIARQLITQVGVASHFDKEGNAVLNKYPSSQFNALWDTGATCTCISKEVVSALGLIPTGMMKATTADGVSDKPVYIIDVFLPNHVLIPQIIAMETQLNNPNDNQAARFDLLVGMDIINHGDFIVSNFRGKTIFTFRIPSRHGYDFIENQYLFPEKAKPSIGRNLPCPCGSGKKHKDCCGSIAARE